nr:MAG TPA: hypothetical protein [Caudoviricetes sp.]
MKIVFVSLPEFKSKHYNLTKRLWIGYSEYYKNFRVHQINFWCTLFFTILEH